MRVEELRERGLILFEVISGSKAYGTNKPTSDTDIRGVYLAPLEGVLGFKYQEQVNDNTNDVVFYELRRFLELLSKQNPNILEMLYMPDDCIIYKHPIMDEIFVHRDKFLTKTCKNSFAGYAVSQIKKAKGLNKKINNPQPVDRKTVLDFCYFLDEGKSIPAKEWLAEHGYNQKYCGLVALQHNRFTYSVYFDKVSMLIDGGIKIPRTYKPFKGVVQDEINSNDISLSEIPKGRQPIGYMHFNKDAYEVHCREWKEFKEWEVKRNPDRYEVTINNGNEYDAKNMMHCIRLIRVAREIATERKILVRRPDRQELLFIRNGQANYDDLIKEADEAITQLDQLYADSDLPDNTDNVFLNDLLLKLRTTAYKL